jgi:hypothetical protein
VRPQDFKPALLAREDVQGAGVVWKRTKEARVYLNVELRPRTDEEHAADAERGRRWSPRAA